MIAVVWFCPLLIAKILMVYDPTRVEFLVEMVSVEMNDGIDIGGVKRAVVFAGVLEMVSVTDAGLPLTKVMAML